MWNFFPFPYFYYSYFNPFYPSDEFYFDDDVEDQQQVETILRRFETQRRDIILELQSHGMPLRTIRYILRTIIRFTINNQARIPGNIEQKTNTLFRIFVTRRPDILVLFQRFRVPRTRANTIIRTVIRFTLENIRRSEDKNETADDLDKYTAYFKKFESEMPEIIDELKAYNIPHEKISKFIKSVLTYSLDKLKNAAPIGDKIENTAEQLLNEFAKNNADIIKDIEDYGIFPQRINGIIKTISIFVLRNAK